MNEIRAQLVTAEGLLDGEYREELIIKNNRLWVPFKIDGGQWCLQCPSQIVVEEV